MPVDGMEKKATCPDCSKRTALVYREGRWWWKDHKNQQGRPCHPDR